MAGLFASQTALITGAASGLGAAIARWLAAEGVRLALFDLDGGRLAPMGSGDLLQVVDITDEETAQRAVAAVGECFGRIDILVNGAGITGKTSRQSHEKDTADLQAVGKEGNAGMLAYSASKAAVVAMAKVQGKEYATSGVTVNALAGMAAYIVSPENSFTTGFVFDLSGGRGTY